MSTLSSLRPLRRSPSSQTILMAAVVVLCAAGAAISGLGMSSGHKMQLVVPVALVLGAVVAVVAMTRFSVFLLLMLALRASVDVSSLGSDSSSTGAAPMSDRFLTPSTLLAGVFLVAAALWLLAQVRAGTLRRGTGLRRAWVLFAVVGFVSMLGSADRTRTLVGAAQVLTIVLMYVVLEQVMADVRTRNRLLAAVYVSAVVPLLYTMAGLALGHPNAEVKDGFTRLMGTFTQSNVYGRYLMLLILFGVAVYVHVPKRWRLWLLSLLSLSAVFLALTYTLTAIFGTALGLVVLGIWHNRKILVGLVVAGLCVLVVAPQLVARVESVTSSTSYYADNHHANSLTWRFSYWRDVLPLADADPVTGIGLNMTGADTTQDKQPHNDFLRAYVEEGLLGEAAYLILLLSLVTMGVRAARASPRGSLDRGIAMGYLACVVALAAGSTSDNIFTNVAVLWYLVAFAAAASNVAQRHRPAVDRAGELTPTGGVAG
ncbi:MAG: O-antigen ligase family protein [Marmoricola sp.]